MFDKFIRRFINGWHLGGGALAVLFAHPRLLVFPLLSALALVGIVVGGGFGLAAAVGGLHLAAAGKGGYALAVVVLGGLFAIYVALWVAMIFLNTALCATILIHQSSGEMSLSEGLAVACRRFGSIVAWSLFAATVGVLIGVLSRAIESWSPWVGRLVGNLLGAAWGIAVYFVVPILAVEGYGPVQAMRASIETVRAQWGEAAGIEASVTWRLWPLHLFGGACMLYLSFMQHNGHLYLTTNKMLPLTIAAIVGLLLYTVLNLAFTHVLRGIARSQLYIFAGFGEVPAGCDPAVFRSLGRKG